MRPEGYVKYSQPMNTSYEKKEGHPRDYGDVVIILGVTVLITMTFTTKISTEMGNQEKSFIVI